MIRLSHAISKVIVDEYGTSELLQRLSDPIWFQAFGCVLGFDWHSSGVTTVVCGVLRQALQADIHGICIAGGKGKKSTATKSEIPQLAESFNLSSRKIDDILYASRMAAKVDNAAIQDGYSLYHHVLLFDRSGNWAVVQQGMNTAERMARRYHWISDGLQNFVLEPHSGIISQARSTISLDMTSALSQENQKICVDIAKSDPRNTRSSVYKLASRLELKLKPKDTLDFWIGTQPISATSVCSIVVDYEMPRNLDWKLLEQIYEIQPRNYEELLSIRGVGPATVRALSLIAELVHGTKASWTDPAKYSFAHGGKDGVPYPVARKVYDESIKYLSGAIEGSAIDRQERTFALKQLAGFSRRIFPSISN
jgi:hypothetical protein